MVALAADSEVASADLVVQEASVDTDQDSVAQVLDMVLVSDLVLDMDPVSDPVEVLGPVLVQDSALALDLVLGSVADLAFLVDVEVAAVAPQDVLLQEAIPAVVVF